MQNDNIIEFQNVSYRYEADDGEEKLPLVVNNISLNFKKGDFIAILGHNGSGKSTLAKLSNSILIPESGKVLVNGMDTADEDLSYDIRRTVGVVFQNPDNQIVATIVEEDVAFGPENLGVPPEEIRKRVDNALKAVGMYEYRGHEPHKLSGGQKQRVAIAGIIAMLPECIVLDEPTAMLDPRGRDMIAEMISSYRKTTGSTVIIVSHSMEDVAKSADKVLVMNKSEVEMFGTVNEVFSKVERLADIGLNVPQLTQIFLNLKHNGMAVRTDIYTIKNAEAELLRLLREEGVLS